MTLHPVVPYRPWETAQSFAGRLARVNGIGSTKIFCEEMGLSLSGLALGRDRDLDRLASLVGLPAERLQENAVRPLGERRFTLRGETLVRQACVRQRLRGRPLCLQEDIDGSPAPAHASAYVRVTWCLTSVRTCQ
ncbi:TniQ family protein, partial [Nostoc sp. NIES-2111]